MKGKQIDAILSDYDGTLCPTTSVRGGCSYDVGTIPQGLEQILFHISDDVPRIKSLDTIYYQTCKILEGKEPNNLRLSILT